MFTLKNLVWLLAISVAVFQIIQGIEFLFPAVYYRPIYLACILTMGLLLYSLLGKGKKDNKIITGFNLMLVALGLYATYVLVIFDYNSLDYLIYGFTTTEQIAGIIIVLLLLELCRRAVSPIMSAIAITFLLYSFFGYLMPDPLTIKQYSIDEILKIQIYSNDGVFGNALAIAAGVIYIYILWGTLLEKSGAGNLFIKIACYLTGRYKGGPAKAAVLSSAFMGSISGSAIANTVTTGAITIPLMRKNGFTREQAGGIEAAASTGGQIMPPIMGAGAFIMAQFTGIPYSTIAIISIAPSLFYFISVFTYVHILACKNNLTPDNLEAISKTEIKELLRKGYLLFTPLIIVIVMLLSGNLPVISGIWGIASVLLVFIILEQKKIEALKSILAGLYQGSIASISVSVACATAGIIVGVVGQTGLSLIFSNYLNIIIENNLFIALIMIALVAMFLGMGLPVTASYIILSVLAVPSLVNFGLPIIVAHLIIFWLSQTSNVTPPIALASFAAAGVAQSDPHKTTIEGFKLSSGLIIIPISMAYTSIIFTDSVSIIMFLESVLWLASLVLVIAILVERHFLMKTDIKEILVLSLALIALIFGEDNSIISVYIPAVLLAVFTFRQVLLSRRQ